MRIYDLKLKSYNKGGCINNKITAFKTKELRDRFCNLVIKDYRKNYYEDKEDGTFHGSKEAFENREFGDWYEEVSIGDYEIGIYPKEGIVTSIEKEGKFTILNFEKKEIHSF